MVCRGDVHAVEGEETGAMRASEEEKKKTRMEAGTGPVNKKRKWAKF